MYILLSLPVNKLGLGSFGKRFHAVRHRLLVRLQGSGRKRAWDEESQLCKHIYIWEMALRLPIYHPRAVLVNIWAAAQDSPIRLTNVTCSQFELCNREKMPTTKKRDRPSRWRENDTKRSGSAPILHLTVPLTAALAGLGLTTNLLLPYKWDLRWSHIIPLPSTPTCLKLQTLDVCRRAAPLSSMSSHRRRREPAHLFANTRPNPEEDICPRGAPQVGVTRSLAPLQGAEISDDLPKQQECSGGPCHLCFCCAFQ